MPHLTRKKAKKILKDKTIRGKKLTKKQRGFFGARAGGNRFGDGGKMKSTKRRKRQ